MIGPDSASASGDRPTEHSTLFIASPIVLWRTKRSGTNLRRAVLDTEQSKIEGVTPPQA